MYICFVEYRILPEHRDQFLVLADHLRGTNERADKSELGNAAMRAILIAPPPVRYAMLYGVPPGMEAEYRVHIERFVEWLLQPRQTPPNEGVYPNEVDDVEQPNQGSGGKPRGGKRRRDERPGG